MPYVAPSTKSAYTTLTSTEWNTVVNDIIDLNLRANMTRGTYSSRPASPALGDLYYQTDTDELVKYVTDVDGTNRWMVADHDYRRNFVINGGFDFWQRGTDFNPTSSSTLSGNNYGADRWQFIQATTSASAFTRQTITATDPVGFNYYARVQRASTLTLTTPYTIQTSFESRNIQNIRGKYVTLSFWARAGANYSAASSFLVSNIVVGTGTDNTVGNFTGNFVQASTNNVLTTTWKRFSITTGLPLSTSQTQLGVSFVFTPTGTAGAADYFDITGVQLETGTAPSDFEIRDAGEELRRCQRYYYRITPVSANTQTLGTGYTNSSTAAFFEIKFPVTMRAAPTTFEKSAVAADYLISSAAINNACTSGPTVVVSSVDSSRITASSVSLVAGQGAMLNNNNSLFAYLAWSAEL